MDFDLIPLQMRSNQVDIFFYEKVYIGGLFGFPTRAIQIEQIYYRVPNASKSAFQQFQLVR